MADDAPEPPKPKKPNWRQPRVTEAQVAAALMRSGGVQAWAARSLKVSKPRLTAYLEKWPNLVAVRDQAREAMIDLAEEKLFGHLRKGHPTAIIFTLKTLGKSRGYVERHELSGSDGGGIPIEDARRILSERLAKLAAKPSGGGTGGATREPSGGST